MTRDEIYAEYAINESGIIQSPGKFQGEPAYTPYFYAFGSGNDTFVWTNGDHTEIFTITVDDRAIWPELKSSHVAVAVEGDENGFVYCVALSRLGLDSLKTDYDDDIESEVAHELE